MLAHLISFYSAPSPTICCWNKDEVIEKKLENEVWIKFSQKSLCTGFMGKEKRNKCPHRSQGWHQCNSCKTKDISNIYTRLDFSEYPELEKEYLEDGFSIYLAQFGNRILKCGVTHTERVATRTMEQGADFWVELLRFSNGRDAYAAEGMLQQKFMLHNAVKNATKLKLLYEPAEPVLIEDTLARVKEYKELENVCSELSVKKNEYYSPKDFIISDAVNGQIMGSKSKLLFYKKDNQDFVVDMSKMGGRMILVK